MVVGVCLFVCVQKEEKGRCQHQCTEFIFARVWGFIRWQSTGTQLWLRSERCIWPRWTPKYIPVVSVFFCVCVCFFSPPIHTYYFLLLYFNNISNTFRIINKELHLLKASEVFRLKYISALMLQTQTEASLNSHYTLCCPQRLFK